MENIYTVLLTAVTVLGSAGAWRFYERRAMHKEKDELRKMIIDLTAKVATLQTTVEFLRKEEEKTKTTRTRKS